MSVHRDGSAGARSLGNCRCHSDSSSCGNPSPDVDALPLWNDNGNGRIACAEARAHGIAPVRRGHWLISTCAMPTGMA